MGVKARLLARERTDCSRFGLPLSAPTWASSTRRGAHPFRPAILARTSGTRQRSAASHETVYTAHLLKGTVGLVSRRPDTSAEAEGPKKHKPNLNTVSLCKKPLPSDTLCHCRHNFQDLDAEVVPVLIPEKDLLDPESMPAFDDDDVADGQGESPRPETMEQGRRIGPATHVRPKRFKTRAWESRTRRRAESLSFGKSVRSLRKVCWALACVERAVRRRFYVEPRFFRVLFFPLIRASRRVLKKQETETAETTTAQRPRARSTRPRRERRAAKTGTRAGMKATCPRSTSAPASARWEAISRSTKTTRLPPWRRTWRPRRRRRKGEQPNTILVLLKT